MSVFGTIRDLLLEVDGLTRAFVVYLTGSVVEGHSFRPGSAAAGGDCVRGVGRRTFGSLISCGILRGLGRNGSVRRVFSLVTRATLGKLRPFEERVSMPIIIDRGIGLSEVTDRGASGRYIITTLRRLGSMVSRSVSSLVRGVGSCRVGS